MLEIPFQFLRLKIQTGPHERRKLRCLRAFPEFRVSGKSLSEGRTNGLAVDQAGVRVLSPGEKTDDKSAVEADIKTDPAGGVFTV